MLYTTWGSEWRKQQEAAEQAAWADRYSQESQDHLQWAAGWAAQVREARKVLHESRTAYSER